MKTLLLTFLLSQGADLTTTVIGLHRGCQELNPLYGRTASISRIVVAKSASTFLISSIAWGIRKKHPKQAKLLLITGIAASALPAVWNMTQLPKC